MKYSIPEQMPSRSDFLTMFFDAIFPDLKAMNCTKTGYGYTSACEQAARETGLLLNELDDNRLEEDSNIFRLMYEMAQSSETIFNKSPNLIADKAYECYSETLFTFCDQTSGVIKFWLKQNGGNKRVNKSFDAALFFSFLLLSRKACVSNCKSFFKKCLEYIGVTEIEDAVSYKLFNFDWEELGDQGIIGEKTFTRLANNANILLGTVVLTIFEMIGTYSAERDQAKLKKLHAMLARLFEKDVQASNAMERAELAFFNSNKFFEPRSIQIKDKLYPQDFFVLPEFELDGEKGVMPLSLIKTATKSNRLLIVAKTGLGKSSFLQMASLCMLSDRLGSGEKNVALQEISEQIKAPKDLFIISVPARMFSFCYKDERYQEWTTDFISLFFNCMWKLSAGFNFYSTQSSQRFIVNRDPLHVEDDVVTEELIDYVQELARTGKLLLILDSFDEIVAGDMREAYLKCLADFCNKYCSYPETNEVGAHIIVSSRQMSPSTMKSLEYAMEADLQTHTYRILPLNATQREKLVLKWKRFLDPDEESSDILMEIEQNHFYLDYSVNPYMLSVVCFYFSYDLGRITQRYISFLTDRMIKINRDDRFADPIIMDVLMNINRILQEVAGETVTNGNPHFSRSNLDKHLKKQINKTDLKQDDVDAYIERLHEIFVTQVGLIVPADGADEDYQFINGQIRYELAAKGIRRALENDENTAVYREVILPSITNIEEYVGLLVPLLCDINLENVQLAELLVSDLAMYDFKAEADESVLIRAMLDLLLNRYGSNITTAATPGDKDAKYVRRAQRMLLMRILTSKSFKVTEVEKEELAHSPAFRTNSAWFSDNVASLMQ